MIIRKFFLEFLQNVLTQTAKWSKKELLKLVLSRQDDMYDLCRTHEPKIINGQPFPPLSPTLHKATYKNLQWKL